MMIYFPRCWARIPSRQVCSLGRRDAIYSIFVTTAASTFARVEALWRWSLIPHEHGMKRQLHHEFRFYEAIWFWIEFSFYISPFQFPAPRWEPLSGLSCLHDASAIIKVSRRWWFLSPSFEPATVICLNGKRRLPRFQSGGDGYIYISMRKLPYWHQPEAGARFAGGIEFWLLLMIASDEDSALCLQPPHRLSAI